MSQGWQYLAYSDVITTVLLAAMCYAFASLIALYYFLCQRDYVFALVFQSAGLLTEIVTDKF